jgi:type I restriction enzyme S subunit
VSNALSPWPTYALTDVFDVRSGLSKPASDFGSGYPFVTFKDVLDNYFLPETLGSLVRSSDTEREVCDVRRGDVFLTRTSETQEELGMSSVALRDYDGATFNGFSKRLRPKERHQIVPEYAAYYFRGPRFRSLMSGYSSLSTRASLNNDMLSRLQIVLPDVKTQEEIGYTLRSLDDKIGQNRRTGRALEGLARATFKAWFVDFEPVKAKAAGAASFPGMLPAAFAALPDRLTDSLVGPVPQGWAVRALAEVFDINPPRRLSKGQDAPYLDMKNMPTDGHAPDTWERRPHGSGMRFINGDTLVARITPCLENGKTAFVDFLNDGEVAWGSTEYIVLRPKSPLPGVYAYCLARMSEFRYFAIQNMTGTSGRQRVAAAALEHYHIAVPDAVTAVAFGEIARPLFECIRAGKAESSKLATLRDYLSPRLLSGDVRIESKRTS